MRRKDKKQQTQQAQQPEAAEVFECATTDVVRELDKDIKRGEITGIIEFLTNVGEHLLQKARNGTMTDFTENYATHGERRRVILRSSREIVYALRNTYPLTEEEVTVYMQQLGYSAVTIDGEPLWRIYELEDIEL